MSRKETIWFLRSNEACYCCCSLVRPGFFDSVSLLFFGQQCSVISRMCKTCPFGLTPKSLALGQPGPGARWCLALRCCLSDQSLTCCRQHVYVIRICCIPILNYIANKDLNLLKVMVRFGGTVDIKGTVYIHTKYLWSSRLNIDKMIYSHPWL